LKIVGGYFHSLDVDVVQEIISSFPFRALQITSPYSDQLPTLQLSKVPIESLLPLEELILNPDGDQISPPERISVSPHNLPNLACLIIGESITFPIFEGPRPFTMWPKLRNLVLRCWLQKFECLSILGDATSLEECTMSVRPDGGTNSIVKEVVLPNLATLKLYFWFESDAQPFLDMLTLPNLTSLKVGTGNWQGGDEGCNEATLRRLAKRSGMKKMETLMISNAAACLDIGILLEILPSLCRLEILSHIAPLDTFTIGRIGSGELGPRLQVLHLQGYHCQLPSLLSVAELRRRQPPECARIHVIAENYPRAVREDEELRIHRLSGDGIEFTVHVGHNQFQSHRRILAQ
jgi:hypothetical protein